MKRAPLGKILGGILGIIVAGGKSRGKQNVPEAISHMMKGEWDASSDRISFIPDAISDNPIILAQGAAIAVVGGELSKLNSRYIGLKADLPLNIKVRL